PALEHEANKGVKAFGDYRRAMDRWGQGFKYMMLSQAAWIASGAVLFGTITAIGTSIKTFVDFHQDLRDTAAIVQATTTGYEKMEKAAVKAFLNSTMSLKDTTNALKILGQTGMEAADAAIALETVYKITTATGADTTTTVKFLTTAINVWKLGAEDAAKVGNILGAALNYSKLEAEDLGVGFNYVAAMAKSLGLSIVDLASIFAVMSNAGIKVSTIGTGLRGVFSKLLDPTNKLEKQLKLVGLTIEDVSLETNNFFDVLKRLETAGFDIGNIFKGMTRREAASLNIMLEQGVEQFNLMREALKDTTAVDVMFERSMRGMKNQIILTGHAIQYFLIGGLSILKPVIIGTASFIRELFMSLDQLRGVILTTAAAWAIYRAGQLLTATATDTLVAAIYRLRTAMWAFLKAHWIIIGISALIIGYTTLKRIIDATTDSLDEQLNKNKEVIDDMRKLRILMMDSNKTQEEKLEILAAFAKDYPQLISYLEKHATGIEAITEATKKIMDATNESTKAIKRQTLGQQQADLSKIEGLLRYERIKRKVLEREGTVFGWFGTWKDPIPDLEERTRELKKSIRILKTELGIFTRFDIPEEKEVPGFKWTDKMEKAFEKLKLKTGSEREKAKKKLIEDLDFYGMVEDQKTSLTFEQIEARILVYQKYYETLKKIEEKEWSAHNRAIEKIQAAIKRQEAELERTTDKERSTKSSLSKFKESLIDDEAKLIKDDYEQRRVLLEKEIVERQRKYDELLAKTKDFYEDVSKLAEKNPLLLPEKDKIDALVKELEK
ncbi:MAG: phage tail tape measure protein, partial [bacterium]